MQANQQFTEMDLALPREWRLSDTGSKTILPRREPFLPPSPSERPQEEHSWSSWVYNERLVAGDFAMTSSGIGPQDVNTDAEFVKGFTDERILSYVLILQQLDKFMLIPPLVSSSLLSLGPNLETDISESRSNSTGVLFDGTHRG